MTPKDISRDIILKNHLFVRFLATALFFFLVSSVCSGQTGSESYKSPRIVFLNPGEPVDRGKGLFWPLTAQLMGVAAETFDMELEVLYAERDHLLMLKQAEELSQRRSQPDYIVMVNEKQTAPKMLRMFEGKDTKILLIHNDMTPEQRSEFGNEREDFSHWIGTATTDEESGTYRMMEELYRQLGSEEPLVLGVTGDRGTQVSSRRAEGVRDYIEQAGRGRELQLAYGNWGSDDAQSKAEILLSRYPDANIIWAANFSMALGVLRAVEALDSPVLVGSTAAPPLSLADLAVNDMAVSMGSHFFIGAWAMVLLYDYHRGVDFADRGGVRQSLDYLSPINGTNAGSYYKMVYEEAHALDFSEFSLYLHPSSGNYEFSLLPLMNEK